MSVHTQSDSHEAGLNAGAAMNRVSVFCERSPSRDDVERSLAGFFHVRFVGVDRMGEHGPEEFTVVDVNLRHTPHLLDIKEWLKRKPKDGKAILAIDQSSRIELTRAYAVGATDVVSRPLSGRELLAKLCGDFAALAGDTATFDATDNPGAEAAVGALQGVFSAVSLGQSVDAIAVQSAGDAVVNELETQGLKSWVETVRRHHSQTYQHCMLVTGVAVAFGQHIGLPQKERQRLSTAGMLHDLGKARIPISILEKAGPLDPNELEVMRQHPQFGVDALGSETGLAPEMLDVVLHHHELLDGSGYPHGLQANEIADLVRIMTISDIYGALIERRSYKPPLTSQASYQILLDMGPKLDKDLVREFGFVLGLDQGD